MRRCPGAPALLEVGTADIDSLQPPPRPEVRERLVQVIAGFINQTISFDEALAIFEKAIGRTGPIEKIRDVLEAPDDPPTFIPDADSDDGGQRKGRPWSYQEDVRLLAGILRFGLENWSTVAQFVGSGRTRAQAAQRWTRGLNPRISKETWSSDEEALLIRLVRQFGDKAWTKIAQALGNRSDVQCRYHYHQISRSLPLVQQRMMSEPEMDFSLPSARGFGSPLPPPPEPGPQSYGPGAGRMMFEQRFASDLRAANEIRIAEVRRLSAHAIEPPHMNVSSAPEVGRMRFAGPGQMDMGFPYEEPSSIDSFLRQFQSRRF